MLNVIVDLYFKKSLFFSDGSWCSCFVILTQKSMRGGPWIEMVTRFVLWGIEYYIGWFFIFQFFFLAVSTRSSKVCLQLTCQYIKKYELGLFFCLRKWSTELGALKDWVPDLHWSSKAIFDKFEKGHFD